MEGVSNHIDDELHKFLDVPLLTDPYHFALVTLSLKFCNCDNIQSPSRKLIYIKYFDILFSHEGKG